MIDKLYGISIIIFVVCYILTSASESRVIKCLASFSVFFISIFNISWSIYVAFTESVYLILIFAACFIFPLIISAVSFYENIKKSK
jgi:hypothetical protein